MGSSFQLPTLRPVAIPTKGLSWLSAIKVWWTVQREWELVDNYQFTVSDGTTIVIPKGYIFNGASVPRMLRWFISPTGIFLIPSLVHDFGYNFDYVWVLNKEADGSAKFIRGTVSSTKPRQKVWDTLFFSVGQQVNGMTWLNRALYSALRMVGFVAWRACRKNPTTQIDPNEIN